MDNSEIGGAILDPETETVAPRHPIERAKSTAQPNVHPRAQPSRRAKNDAPSTVSAPGDPIGAAQECPQAVTRLPRQPHSALPKELRKPKAGCSAEPELSGHPDHGIPPNPAAQPIHGTGHYAVGTHSIVAGVVEQIIEQWRRRMDMLRARQRLELQAQAICRRYVDGDKVEAGKLWLAVKADPAHDLRVWLAPFLSAIAPLDAAKGEIEKALVKLVKKLPIYPWAQSISGLGDVSLAGIVGEAGRGPGEYRSVSALWKRMGLAVIEGGRQRRVTGAAALDHGYCAERRSHMWNISASLIKAQIRSLKGEDGKKVEGSSYALGELGQVYLDRKAYLNARELETPWTPAHVHNDAARYMAKRLLRMLWSEWRRAVLLSGTNAPAPAAEPFMPLARLHPKPIQSVLAA